RDPNRPWMRALFAQAQRDAAAARPAQAQADILEIPFIAALLIVDDQVAVLQADLVEILPIEAGQAQAVEPIEAGEQSVLCTAVRRRSRLVRRVRRSGARRWRRHQDLARKCRRQPCRAL